MSHVYERLYYHFVWATWDRNPILEGAIQEHAYSLIQAKCRFLNCRLLAIGGIADHIHILVCLPRTLGIPRFIEGVKGHSSNAINQTHSSSTWAFKWQGGYGIQSVSPTDVKKTVRYIQNQKAHHESGKLWLNAEKMGDDTTPPR